MRLFLIGFSALFACAHAPAAQPAGSCAGPEYHALDFWLGSWDVATAQGFDGDNTLTRALGGCAVREQWTDAAGWQGESLFTWDRARQRWQQVWITANGDWHEAWQVPGPAGAVKFASPKGTTTLRKLPDGRVSQLIESPGQKPWEGFYSAKASPCTTPQHHELDFWLGDWTAKIRARKTPAGEEWQESTASNHVSRGDNGCTIVEDFHAAGPGAPWTGRSVSQLQHDQWRQTWVDESNSFLAFTGGKQGAEFILTGEPKPLPDGGTRQMRMVFSEIAKDSFRWRWEGTRDGGHTWRPQLFIDYARR